MGKTSCFTEGIALPGTKSRDKIVVVQYQSNISYSGSPSSPGSYGREEQAFAGESNVQQESYDPGEGPRGGETSISVETGKKEHKLEKALKKLEAEGKGNTEQARVLKNYINNIPDARRAELGLRSQAEVNADIYNIPIQDKTTTDYQYDQAAYGLSEWEKIQKLAGMEAADPKYAKSWEGQKFIEEWQKSQAKPGKTPDQLKQEAMASREWRDQFGMPSIVSMPTYAEKGYSDLSGEYWFGQKDPTKTTLRTDEYGQKVGGKYIYSGLGQTLMDQLEGATSRTLPPGFDYGTAKETYWGDRAAQESIDQSQRTSWGGYDGGGGGDGGTGYYGDPRTGNPVEQMANFYTPQANLQQAMVNVHGTPTVFAKRGGIVSLLELR
jgi:hypothetical protein